MDLQIILNSYLEKIIRILFDKITHKLHITMQSVWIYRLFAYLYYALAHLQEPLLGTWSDRPKEGLTFPCISLLFWYRVNLLSVLPRGLPLITYTSRVGGVGGSTLMHTNVYKGGGGV